MIVNCYFCGKEVVKRKCDISNYRRQFCDRKCWGLYRAANLNTVRQCFICNEILTKSQKIYCSRLCQNIAYRKDAWNKIVNGRPTTLRYIKSLLVSEYGWACQICNLSIWMNSEIPLQVHHIDGDSTNNHKENLQLVCPNCHAQTPTWGARNKGRGRAARREKRKMSV